MAWWIPLAVILASIAGSVAFGYSAGQSQAASSMMALPSIFIPLIFLIIIIPLVKELI